MTYLQFEVTPDEVPLERAPLAKVIAQIKFSPDYTVLSSDFIAAYQRVVRDRYPIVKRIDPTFVQMPSAAAPVIAGSTQSFWRLVNLDESWSLNLGVDFIALETSTYESRADLVSRWHQALQAIIDVDVVPARIDRIGLRYINRVSDAHELERLDQLVHPDLLGVKAHENSSFKVIASIGQCHLRIDECDLRASWGLMPAGAIMQPGEDPVDSTSWTLDVDIFTEAPHEFDVASEASRLHRFAECGYAFFRWAVTDDLLEEHGGDV